MFTYYLRLGFRSLLRNPILTALMVITLGIGIAASMSTLQAPTPVHAPVQLANTEPVFAAGVRVTDVP